MEKSRAKRSNNLKRLTADDVFLGLDNDDDGGKWTRHDLLFGSVRGAKKVAFK